MRGIPYTLDTMLSTKNYMGLTVSAGYSNGLFGRGQLQPARGNAESTATACPPSQRNPVRQNAEFTAAIKLSAAAALNKRSDPISGGGSGGGG